MAVICGCEKPFNESDVLIEAEKNIGSHQYNAAIINLKNLLKRSPDNFNAREKLAYIYLKIGRYKSAEKEFRRAISLKDSLVLKKEVVFTLLMQSRHKDALNYISKHFDKMEVEAEKELNNEIMLYTAKAKLGLGESQEAEKLLLHISAGENYIPAQLELAKIYLFKSEHKLAENIVDKILEKDKQHREAWLVKADSQRSLGEHKNAIVYYHNAINDEVDPDGIRDVITFGARLGKINSYFALGELENVNINLNILLDSNMKSHPMVRFYHAYEMVLRSNITEADQLLNNLLSDYPDHLGALYLLSTIKYAQKNYSQSEFYVQKVLQKNPNNFAAEKLLARLKILSSQPIEAEQILSKYVTEDNYDKETFLLLARIAAQGGRTKLASNYLDKIDQNEVRKDQGTLEIANIQLLSGKYSKAIAILNQMPISSRKPFLREFMLIQAYSRLEDFVSIEGLLSDLYDQKGEGFQNKIFVANVYASLGLWENAKKRYQELLLEDNSNIEILLGIAKSFTGLRRYEKSNEYLIKLKKLDGKNITYRLMLSNNYFLMKDERRSEQELEELLLLDNKPSRLNAIISAVYFKRQQFELAEKYSSQAIKLDPNDLTIKYMLSKINYTIGKHDEAIALLNELIREDKSAGYYFLELGKNYLSKGETLDAKYALKQVIVSDESYVSATILLARINIQEGEIDDALHILENSRKHLLANIELALEEASIYVKKSDFKKAEQILVNHHQANGSPLIAIKIFELRKHMGFKMPEKILLDWLNTYPNSFAVKSVLVSSYILDKKFNLARNILEELINSTAIKLADNKQKAMLYNNLAWVYFELDIKESIDFARSAYKLLPNDGAIIDTLGWILLNNGNISEGYELLEQANRLNPGNEEIMQHLMHAKERLEKRAESSAQNYEVAIYATL